MLAIPEEGNEYSLHSLFSVVSASHQYNGLFLTQESDPNAYSHPNALIAPYQAFEDLPAKVYTS